MNTLDIKSLTKLYYTIGEVADMFDVNPSLIRFWEKEFKLIQLNKKGNRLFTPKDIEKFNKIYQLVKVQGFTLDGAKKALRSKNVTIDNTEQQAENSELINRLEGVKGRLLNLKS